MSCSFDYTAFVVSGKVGTLQTRFNYTSWITVVTLTDRPKSVRNRCTCNRSFWWRFYVFATLFGFFCRCRGFCHRTESDLILFLLKANFYAKFEENLRTSTYQTLHDFYHIFYHFIIYYDYVNLNITFWKWVQPLMTTFLHHSVLKGWCISKKWQKVRFVVVF